MRTAVLAAAALAISGSLAGIASSPASAAAKSHNGFRLTAQQPTMDGSSISAAVKAAKKAAGPDGRVSVIAKLTDASLASYRGGVAGLAATSPKVTGARKLDPSTAASRDYLSYLHSRMNAFQERFAQKSSKAHFNTRLDIVVGGLAVTLPATDVIKLAKDPEVAAILPDTLNHPMADDRSPGFIGAPSAWTSAGGQEKAGEGVIVGMLDTGIWPEHPSLSDPDPSGKPYTAARPPLSGTRQCDFSSGTNPGPAFTCNNKLIGGYTFLDTYDAVQGLTPAEYTDARDDEGHGTHTATTAAGNAGVAASIFGVPRGTVSGIAPRAHIIAYKVCGLAGCFGSDSAAAVQRAIQDDVDVINFSIGGGSNPYTDVVSLAFLDAYNAGIFVSASAGNDGPGADTVAHREPWVTTVAASSLDRSFVGSTTLTSSDSSTLTVPGVTVSRPLTSAAPVVNAADAPYNDALCQDATPDSAFAGKVVICERGVNGRIEKGSNVLARGAVGMILYNPTVQDQETDNHFLPAIHINNTDGASVIAFLGAHPGVQATIASGVATPSQGDVMAAFSSRGGPGQSLGISKPDVTAPGIQILAGDTPTPLSVGDGATGQLFQAIAGTSMSSPHVAGSGALLAGLHPTWTPGQIHSALMTTATTTVVKEDGVTPTDAFDDGSGRVNLATAKDPWFTFDETGANYLADEDALYKANYPSLYVPVLAGSLTVSRTLTSVASKSRAYTTKISAPSDLKVSLSANKFTLGKNASRTLNITVDGRNVPIGATRFATITFKTGGRNFTFPITIVRGQGPVAVDKTCAPDPVVKGGTVSCSVTMTNESTSPATVSMRDTLPNSLALKGSSVVGGTASGNSVRFDGTIAARQAPDVTVVDGTGTTPAGYLPLSLFGVAPIAGVGDETITNFNVPAFTLAGVTYTSVGMVSNGYAVLGGGTQADVDFINQAMPDATPPNNVIAPFWTDLNPGVAGAMRIGSLTDGVSSWIVLDWEGVKEFSTATTDSFQIWIGVASNPVPEDVSMTYGSVGSGDGGFVSVGAENSDGSKGSTWFLDGSPAANAPAEGTELRVVGTPGVTTSQVVTFDARAKFVGPYVNYATVTGDTFDGTAIARFGGTITH
jgi:subtilisin family serine protease